MFKIKTEAFNVFWGGDPEGAGDSTSVASSRSGSLFEAKMGAKVHLASPISGDPVSDTSGLPGVRKAAKEARKHLQTSQWGTFPFSPDVAKKIMKKLTTSFDPLFFAKLPVPQELEWADKVYRVELFATGANFYNVSAPHLGSMEARMVFDGTITYFGLPVDEVPGRTLRDKREWLMQANVADLTKMVKEKGWACKHDHTHLMVIPSGFIVVQMCDELCYGLRWSMGSDARDSLRVKSMLKLMVDSYPELGNQSQPHSTFMAFLDHIEQ